MPPDRPCRCGGSGADRCVPTSDPLVWSPSLDALRTALALDTDRPLGLHGALTTDRTIANLRRLSEPAGRSLAAGDCPPRLPAPRPPLSDQLEVTRHAGTLA